MSSEFWLAVAQTEFWIAVTQTAIGSAIGFVFGIFAFWFQQSRQSVKEKKDDWRSALDALNRLMDAAGANIEALALAKLQLLNDLRPEAEKMKAASNAVYESPREDWTSNVRNLKALGESMRHFYKSLPIVSVMPPPNFSEYSLLSKDMPALSLFAHRAIGMTQELNEHIASRNALITEYAREGGTDDGITGERVHYYSSMLAGRGDAICNQTDFALCFWRLVREQIRAYRGAKAKDEPFSEYKLAPYAMEAMPEEELVPYLREQLVTFDDS